MPKSKRHPKVPAEAALCPPTSPRQLQYWVAWHWGLPGSQEGFYCPELCQSVSFSVAEYHLQCSEQFGKQLLLVTHTRKRDRHSYSCVGSVMDTSALLCQTKPSEAVSFLSLPVSPYCFSGACSQLPPQCSAVSSHTGCM